MNFLSSRAVFVPLWCWCCTAVLSFPLISRQQAVSDVDVLQFALTLEHLENTFYKQALAQFSEVDFIAAGFDASFFVNLQFVAHDEEQHVVFLQQAISQAGATPVAACQYTFPFTDVASFVGLATVLEGVGVSAYLGAASIISSKEILNAAAAITVAEGLHQAVQRASILDVVSANIAGTPLSPNAVFTIASAFIQSCPSTNAELPFSAFPELTVVGSAAAATAASTSVSVNSVATLAISSSSTSSISLPQPSSSPSSAASASSASRERSSTATATVPPQQWQLRFLRRPRGRHSPC
ncbi:hypothetical protein T310_3572 [Rasamsonia emersonii CBS 393.64]|uniref:Uncharacterized protein n=1 Tax=Rasamsonia emersonii (strain ATCC 16479 / CBS 393.64 / IMI 116815) TaxID=1408163 RepID=A0A0F4YWZ0_RASE3|nr:hypothetical protein T310_3572 [Rasamsonia emersonii CBS 393.64]KKA22366.1 hypothetical protein T310_3572 [Rasamsonia emersonii CBS 393.64]